MVAEDDTHDPGRADRDLSLHVFSISAGMVGVCLTGIGLVRVTFDRPAAATIGDEVLAADAVLFCASCGLSFWAFKTTNSRHRRVLAIVIDVIFMLALVTMVGVCTLLAYAIA